jgi:hypothetical protein
MYLCTRRLAATGYLSIDYVGEYFVRLLFLRLLFGARPDAIYTCKGKMPCVLDAIFITRNLACVI